MLSREVGVKNVGGVDTPQPEYGKYQWTYYPAGNANQYLMSAAIDANGNQTNFNYDNNHKLLQVLEPPDAPGGARATTTIAYDVSSRIQTITDPVSRQVQFTYDQRDRNVTITYGDTSTEKFYYGAQGSGNENLLVKRKNRNGVTNEYSYDAAGRLTQTVFAYSIIDANNNETLITDPSVQVPSTLAYLPGTELPVSSTDRGETTTYAYDYRQRQLSASVQPRVGVTLTSTATYLNNLLFSEQDPYGRSQYFAHRSSDGALIRQIQGTVPSFTLANFAAVTSQTRATGSNAQYLITDYTLDNNGQFTIIFDGNNNQDTQSFDSRSQLTQSVEASGTPIAAKTAFAYDANGNQVTVQTPRYFDPNDPQTGKVQTVSTYTGRNLLATKTEAPGTTVAATTQFTYDLDRTQATMVDPRNNTWTTLWSACCAGRKTSELDPLNGGSSLEYDYAGNLTYSQVLQGTTVYNYVTTLVDPRGRPSFRTVWLVAPPAVDPNNPPIAGQNGVPAANGVTTQWVYDENLADNVGLSAAAGQNIAGVGNVSIAPLLSELQADGITFGTGSDGFAALEIRPDGELAVSIVDGVGRSVATGTIQPPTGQNPNQPITWRVRFDDTVVSINGFGNVLETASINALDNTERRRTDGAGRPIQSLDAANNVTALTYDANSNRLSASDPNAVGYSAVFDARNRQISRTDTANATVQTQFDANSNVVKTIDAKNASGMAVFDARDRRATATDRINGVTSWSLDANSNLLSITDTESRTTSFQYDARNLKTAATYADNNPPTVNDQRVFAYDGAKRLVTLTAQTADYATYVWDQANRLTARQYRDSTKQPTDPPNDTDSFTFDGAGHALTAASGRYGNTLTFAYDQAGRLDSESLTMGGQTYVIGRSYDAANRLTGLTYPDSATVGRTYTNRNQLQQVTYNSATAASFSYDPGRRRSMRTLGDTPGTETSYAYSTGDNTLASISTPNLPGFSYSFDANKNKMAETITGVLGNYGFSTGAAGYDAIDRLLVWNRSDNARNQSWTLTAAGDWSQFIDAGTTHNRTHNTVHETTAVDGSALAYDLKGNLVNNAVTAASYIWDFDNQLNQATVGGATTTFAYDAFGRRVAKTVGAVTTVYVSASGKGGMAREIVEYASGAAPASPSMKYVFGPHIDEPLVMDAGGTLYYYQSNSQFSVEFMTNAAGSIVECYCYTGYGSPLIFAADGVTQRATSSIGNQLMFTGRRLDPETGLYFYRARYYDAGLGRFLGRDRSGGEGAVRAEPLGLLNLYEYVAGTPLVASDPSGLEPQEPPEPPDPTEPPDPPQTKRQCKVELCCSSMLIDGKEWSCQGKVHTGEYPCHCFVRLTEIQGDDDDDEKSQYDLDYHGFGDYKNRNKDCAFGPLRCGTKLPAIIKLIGDTACIPLEEGDCDKLNMCLSKEKDKCNDKKKYECYDPYCVAPNSNTSAYRFATAAVNCLNKKGKKLPKPPIPGGTEGQCTFAPGYEQYPKPKSK